MKGRGINPPKGATGDLYVTFDVLVPEKLDADQRKAVEALGEAFAGAGNPREQLGV